MRTEDHFETRMRKTMVTWTERRQVHWEWEAAFMEAQRREKMERKQKALTQKTQTKKTLIVMAVSFIGMCFCLYKIFE